MVRLCAYQNSIWMTLTSGVQDDVHYRGRFTMYHGIYILNVKN